MIFVSADFLKFQHNCFTIFQKFEIRRNILINAEAIHVSHTDTQTHRHTHTHTQFLSKFDLWHKYWVLIVT